MKKSANSSKVQDDEEFEILLSREDYNEMKANQKRLKKMESQFKEKMIQWQTRQKQLVGELSVLIEEKKEILAECESVKQVVQTQYSQFVKMISQLRTSCGLSMIKQDSQTQQIKQLTKMVNEKKTNPKLLLCLIQKLLTNMTELLSRTISPIQDLLSGHKLTSQALNDENHRCEHQLEKLAVQIEELKLQKSTLQKQYQFKLAQLRNQLTQQHSLLTKNLWTQISQLRQHNIQLIAKLKKVDDSHLRVQKESELLSQQNNQLHQQIKQLQQENKQYQQHIKILKSKHNRYQEKHHLKQNEAMNVSNNQNNNYPYNNNGQSSPIKKYQKQTFIKQTLIQYSRQIKNNLIAIGNLSQDQIKQIGVSELKTLVKFIHQLEEDFQ